jgi:hypothetical protein
MALFGAKKVGWQRGGNGRLVRISQVDLPSRQGDGALRSDLPSELSHLPQEVIAHIFSYLPFYDVLKLASVCSLWKDASHCPGAFRHVDFTWVDLLSSKKKAEYVDVDTFVPHPRKSGKLAERLMTQAGSLSSLRLGLSHNKSSGLNGTLSGLQATALIERCTGLRTLHLSSGRTGMDQNIQIEIVKLAATFCPRLSHLQVAAPLFAFAGEKPRL